VEKTSDEVEQTCSPGRSLQNSVLVSKYSGIRQLPPGTSSQFLRTSSARCSLVCRSSPIQKRHYV